MRALGVAEQAIDVPVDFAPTKRHNRLKWQTEASGPGFRSSTDLLGRRPWRPLSTAFIVERPSEGCQHLTEISPWQPPSQK
eukprot:866649-Amphidinium_carterae.1